MSTRKEQAARHARFDMGVWYKNVIQKDVFPQPCRKYVDKSDMAKQIKKLNEEIGEVFEAYANYQLAITTGQDAPKWEIRADENLAEELMDVIVSATTALEMLGYDATARGCLAAVVNDKNRARGYLT